MNYKNNMIVRKTKSFLKYVALSVLVGVLFIPTAPVQAKVGLLLGATGGDKNVSYGLGVSFGNLFNNGLSVNRGGVVGIGQTILYIINGVLIPLIFAISFITFLWGIYKYFIAQGDSAEGQEKGKQLILYGIIGFAVMVSLWGLVNIVASTFGLTGQTAPQIPLSY